MRQQTTRTKRTPKKRLSIYLHDEQIQNIETMKKGIEESIGSSFIYSFNAFISICIEMGLRTMEERSQMS